MAWMSSTTAGEVCQYRLFPSASRPLYHNLYTTAHQDYPYPPGYPHLIHHVLPLGVNPSMRSPGSQPHTCDSASLLLSLTTTKSSPKLPNCMPIVDPTFTWGCHDATTFITSLNAAYNEVVHWRPNLFRVPYGKAGKSFVFELARLYNSASKSAMECIAMRAAVVVPILMLQKPSSKSEAKEHNSCLERCLNTWLDGDLDNLLVEGRTLQQRIPKSALEDSSKHRKRHACSFANLMFKLQFA